MDESDDHQAEGDRQAGNGRDKEAGLQTTHRQAATQRQVGKQACRSSHETGRNREADRLTCRHMGSEGWTGRQTGTGGRKRQASSH
jgi:hypothetical protein